MNKSRPAIDKLAIIVGDGDLPLEVLKSVETTNIDFGIIQFDGVPSQVLNHYPTIQAQFEKIHDLFQDLKRHRYKSIAFCGYIRRPILDMSLVCFKSGKMLAPLIEKMHESDEALFNEILVLFKSQDLEPISLSELIPDSFCSESVLTNIVPSELDITDTLKAEKIFQMISNADLGQSLVISNGLCLAVESILGTDLMLEFLGNLKKNKNHFWQGGVLYKRPKIAQNPFIDTPVIGQRTVRMVKDAGLNGITLQSNKVIILDKGQTVKLAEKLGIFIWSKK